MPGARPGMTEERLSYAMRRAPSCCQYPLAPRPFMSHMTSMEDQAPPVAKCPICAKPAAEPFRPFCSKRCRDVDLNRWLSGVYAVPGKEEEDEDGLGGERAGEEDRRS